MKLRAIAAAAFLTSLGACSTLRDDVSSSQQTTLETTSASLDEAAEPAPTASAEPFRIEQGSYLALRASRVPTNRRLPDALERDGVTLAAAMPLDLAGIASLLTRVTGLPVALDDASHDTRVAMPSNDDAARLGEALSSVAPRALANGNAQAAFAMPEVLSERRRMTVRFQGPLSRFLEQVETQFNVGWRYEDGKLHLARTLTRSFPIAALPSLVKAQADLNIGLTSDVGDSGGGGGGGGGSDSGSKSGVQQSASVQVAFDLWKDIEAAVKTILGGQGAYSLSRGLSSLTVTAPPRVMDAVSAYIAGVNRQLERQVTVNVAVYSVSLDDESERRFSLNGLFRGGRFTGGIGDVGELTGDTISAGVLDGRHGSIASLLKLLDSTGRVSVVTNASVTTMSGQPVPLQVSNARGYVSKVGSILNQVSVQREITTSTVTTGFALNVLPKVLDSGEVLLQYGVNISSLVGRDDGFERVSLGDKEPTLSLPNVDQRSFVQESMLRNGATLVMAGFQHVNETAQEDGKGDPSFKLLGGSSSATRKRQLIVICITPKVHRRDASLARAGD